MSETSNTEDTRSTGQKVSDWIGDQLKKTKPVQAVQKAAKAIDDFNNSDYVKQNAEKWKKWNDDRNAREAAERQAHEEWVNSPEYQAQQEADEEAKRKAEEERKAKELEKRQGIYDEVMGNIRNSSKTADAATTKAAFELGSAGGTDNYEDLGRARSAGMSMADDATIAAKSIAQNAMANRRTAFDEAVKAGSDKLKAEGYDKAASNLEEAGKLQSEAQLTSNLTNGLIGTYITLSDLYKGINL